MLRNYLAIAFGNMRRSPSYTFINVSGLALGITCALLIFFLVSFHLSFDTFHHDADRIYRFVTEEHSEAVDYEASVPPAFGKAFRDDYTFAEKVARLSTEDDVLITVGGDAESNKFKMHVSFAEPEFFDIFNFPLISGDPRTILTESNTAVIDEATSNNFFGNDEAIGRTFTLDNHIEFKVTGILHDFPENSDLRSHIFLSWATMRQYNPWYAADDSWQGITSSIQTFGRLRPGVNPSDVEKVLPAYVKKYRAKSKNVHVYKLQPLSDVHFNPQYDGKISKTVLSLLSITAFLLVFMASLNFINIATAQAINRAREVGVRKSLGGTRSQLFWQFTLETAALVVISTIVAFAIAYSVVPYLTTLLKTNFTIAFSDYRLLLFAGLLILSVTFLAGAYPSFVLARFKAVAALKGKASDRQAGGFNLRRLLITTQFVIAQVLLIALIVFIYQMDKFRNADMGFDRNAIVLIPLGSKDLKANTLKAQFEQIPGVTDVTMCLGAPASESNWTTMIHFDNRTDFEGFSVNFKSVDEDYLRTFGLELLAGRNLEPSDTVREFLVNETFVHKAGLQSDGDILGRTIQANGASGPVVGVVRDFHEYSLHKNVGPVYMATWKERYHEYAVKITMGDVQQTLGALRNTWLEMYPERYYSYQFLDEEIGQFYKTEETMLKLVMVFASIALTIGCLGVYGLVSFMAIRKTKEIGIRKVLGGSIAHILWLFGKEFSRLVLLAFLFAAPLGWWIVSRWLEHYAYRVHLRWWIFALEAGLISVIVILTVSFESLRAALKNPADSLRSE